MLQWDAEESFSAAGANLRACRRLLNSLIPVFHPVPGLLNNFQDKDGIFSMDGT
jgi:hypothetical protein